MRGLVLKWAATAVAVGITAAWLPGISLSGGFGTLLIISLVWGLVNAIIGPIARLLSIPITVMTLGLFLVVIDGLLFAITDWLSDRLEVDNFLWAIVGAVVLSVLTLLLDKLIGVFTKDK